jgi:predicted PurR-regulated permease PerM
MRSEVETEFRNKALFVVKIVLTALIITASVYIEPEVFLLVFAGILVSIFLLSTSDTLKRFTGIPAGWSLGIVVLTMVAVFGAISYFAAPSVADQFDQLLQKVEKLKGQI